MHASDTAVLEPQLQRIEADLQVRIAAVFRKYPYLAGFSLQDSTCVPDCMDRTSMSGELFITELVFVTPVNSDRHEEVCDLIERTVSDMLGERTEAFDLLRDRTFARTLH